MSKLGTDAKALIAAGRDALRPTQTDRERVLDALRTRIEHGAGPATNGAPASTGLGWPLASGLLAGAALVGALLWELGDRAQPTPAVLAPALSISSVVARPTPAPTELALPPPTSSSATSAAAPEPARGATPRSSGGSLAEEVALLSRAETELHASRFGKALRLLDDYERRFPKGALMQENVAARVQALCGVGRVVDAKAQLKRLSPGSPHAGRARAACGKERL